MPIEATLEELRAELRAVREQTTPDAIRAQVEAALEQRQSATLLPLSTILGKTAAAARAQLNRDDAAGGGLRKLGVPDGKRRLRFRPAEVEAYLKSRGAR